MCTSKGGAPARVKPRTKGISEVVSENINKRGLHKKRSDGIGVAASKNLRKRGDRPVRTRGISEVVVDDIKKTLPKDEETGTPGNAYRAPKKVTGRTLLTKKVPRTKTRTLL